MSEDELLNVILRLSQNVDNFIPLHSGNIELYGEPKKSGDLSDQKSSTPSSEASLSTPKTSKKSDPPPHPV